MATQRVKERMTWLSFSVCWRFQISRHPDPFLLKGNTSGGRRVPKLVLLLKPVLLLKQIKLLVQRTVCLFLFTVSN